MGAGKLDLTDLAVLRELMHPQTFQWDVRISYAEVGRRLGLDEETVRARVKRMEAEGTISGWTVYLNPRVLGREMVYVRLRLADADAKHRVLPAVQAMDGVLFVFEHHEPSMGVVMMQEPGRGLHRALEVLAALTGFPAEAMPVSFPPVTTEVGEEDWRVIRALRTDVRRSYGELAGDLAVSERTLRRRVERLTSGRVLYLMPQVDITRVHGLVAATFFVVHKDPAKRDPVDAYLKQLPGKLFQWFEGPASRVSVGRSNMAEIEAVRRELVQMPGVERVIGEIQIRRIVVDEWLDELIARRAEGKA